MATAGIWLLKLQCYHCRSVFTVRHIPGDRIAAATEASACPDCGARAARPRRFTAAAGHFVLAMQPDSEGRE